MLIEVLGQDHALPFLRRLGDKNFASPLLLDGEDGTGRRFAAIQATKEALCSGTREPGCVCYDCQHIDHNSHPDVRIIQPEGEKDIGVDIIRDLVEVAQGYPSNSAFRFFIIDGADRLTMGAANAVLKTLEEPPPTSRFILTAENYHEVIPTIRSRCGRVTFGRLPEKTILSVLQRFESDPAKALVHARIADGSIGRAIRYWGSGRLHLRDQVLSLLELGIAGDLSSLFSRIDTIAQGLPLALRFLEQILHDLLIMVHDGTRMINIDVADRLAPIRSTITNASLGKLVSGLRIAQARANVSRINLAFHIKTLFVESFFVAV